jgi:hypothetical protein
MTDLPSEVQPQTTAETTTEDDHGAALERAAGSIQEAREAEGTVAAADDITSQDEERAGEHSPDPDGEGGRP